MQVQNERPQSVTEAEAQACGDYRWLLDDSRGRRLARAVLRWSGITDTGPTKGTEEMAFAAGSRMVGNLLKAQIIKFAPEAWLRLEGEHVQELAAAARREVQQAAELQRDTPKDATP